MADDEARIRALIERWADAVHAGDLQTVVADQFGLEKLGDRWLVGHEHHSFPLKSEKDA